MHDADSLRLFLAVMPDADAARELAALTRQAARCGGHPVAPDALHLTLCFLGPVARWRLPRIETVVTDMTGLPSCVTTFDLLAILAHDLLVLEATAPPAPLLQLQTRMQQSLCCAGFSLEQRSYRPHITLLRHVDPTRHPATQVVPVTLHIDHLALLQSIPGQHGSKYRQLGRWTLQ